MPKILSENKPINTSILSGQNGWTQSRIEESHWDVEFNNLHAIAYVSCNNFVDPPSKRCLQK